MLRPAILLSLAIMFICWEVCAADFDEIMKDAKKGVPWQQYRIARMYYFGDSITKNYAEAINWYQKAAANGNADAALELGRIYLNGDGAAQDFRNGLQWMYKASELGSDEAKKELYLTYNRKWSTEESQEIVSWTKSMASQGHHVIQVYLGQMYADGRGVEQNKTDALQWYNRAAQQGDIDALSFLGAAYESGDGVSKDIIQSYTYLSVAKALDAELGSYMLNMVEAEMTPEQISQAQKSAAQELEQIKKNIKDTVKHKDR